MLLNSRHPHPNPVVRAWRAFRRWRVRRPFSGGLLTLLAGLEIFGTTQMGGDGMRLQVGPTGFLSWLIPTILIACGLLMWFTPQQRLFYAVVAVVTAVFSLVAVNLGGFVIGLLLGMVGGALGFAWTPSSPPSSAGPALRPATGSSEPAGAAAADDLDPSVVPGFADDPTDPTSVRRADPPTGGTFVAVLVLACLAATGLTVIGGTADAQAASCASAQPTQPAEATSTAPAPDATPLARPIPTPSASATPGSGDGVADGGGGNIVTDLIGGIWDLLTGGGDKDPAVDATPEPTTSPDPDPTVKPAPGRSPAPVRTSAPARPGTCPTGSPTSPAPVDEPVVPKLAPEPGQPMVNREPSRLSGSKVTMYGLRLDGIVELPTVDGPLRTLRFSMRRAVTDDFDLRITGPAGRTLDIRSSALTVEGDVRFYATSFTGSILGIPLTLTPDSPVPPDGIPLTVPLIAFDNPQMRLAFVVCDRLTAPNLDESLPL